MTGDEKKLIARLVAMIPDVSGLDEEALEEAHAIVIEVWDETESCSEEDSAIKSKDCSYMSVQEMAEFLIDKGVFLDDQINY